ncbi:NWD2 [Cordylochernes scorpioides]|uniref:NWD2 n=1 Tax=Cordylochernes scorpioides TaxID=51811 RepID=A0ABY6JXS4_9ARAC|nr:NWD2 [Cordylochernes scorpioides]
MKERYKVEFEDSLSTFFRAKSDLCFNDWCVCPTDMSLERNTLMEEVYPRLKAYCRDRHGLEFQVVDMRWGVRDEATDDHMTTELCMKEIENCQRLSMGPNFVVFLGQKYGYRPIPTFIPGAEFRELREILDELKVDAAVLDEWYWEDTNNLPSVFVLQPISSILPNFNNKRAPRLQATDQATWWKTLAVLQKLLRRAAQALFARRRMAQEAMHHFMMSVTEREVIHGLLQAPRPRHTCLAYVRHIEGISLSNLRVSGRFIDLENRQPDDEAQNLLADLRDNRLPSRISHPNLVRFTVEWSGRDGLDASAHSDYLARFTHHFERHIKRLVDRAVRRAFVGGAQGPAVGEILQHLHACRAGASSFLGREAELTAAREYIQDPARCQPLVFHGHGGCGKTSLLAKIASMVWEWSPQGKKPARIIRFLGITPESSSLVPMIKSLCYQISYNYCLPADDLPEDLVPLVAFLKKLLTQATEEQPLCIVVDSLDQLEGPNKKHRVSWLPIFLPLHVKMIVSILSEKLEFSDFQIIKKMIESKNQFIEVQPVGVDLAMNIMKSWLNGSNRCLTCGQYKVVKLALTKCNLPIFVKLVYAEVLRWRSYFSYGDTTLCFVVMDSIIRLLERIEKQHGRILVAHALAYITASKSGVSESELEDLLSLDDTVLEDVYQYHLPPVRRIPPLLWTRIRNDLPNYLTEREADGITVLNWYHRQFREAAVKRYFRNPKVVPFFHNNLAEYFMGIWGGGIAKPFRYSEIQRMRFGIEAREGSADRKVPSQPMAFQGKTIRYNLRKFGELPFHLVRAKRYEDLFYKVLFNYFWIFYKLSCCPLQSLLADYDDVKEFMDDPRDIKQISLMSETFRLGSAILSHHPRMLAPQLLGRLLPVKHMYPLIKILLNECDKHGPEHCALLPSYPFLHTPGGPLKHSLEGHQFAVFSFAITSDKKYVVSASNRFIVWDLFSGDITQDIDPDIRGIVQGLELSRDDKYAVCYTNYNLLVIFNVLTGDVITADTGEVEEFVIRGLSISTNYFVVWTENYWLKYDLLTGKLLHKLFIDDERILQMDFGSGMSIHLICEKKVEEKRVNVLQTIYKNEVIQEIEFGDSLTFSGDQQNLYITMPSEDSCDVFRFTKHGTIWEDKEVVLTLYESPVSINLDSGKHLVISMSVEYILYNLVSKRQISFALPDDTRNFALKPFRSQNTMVISKDCQYAIAAIRKSLYIWAAVSGALVKVLDAHFGRILMLRSAISEVGNLVVTSSIDRTLKVWNVDNLFEKSFPVDRMEMPVDSISVFHKRALTVTRSSLGWWDIRKGQLLAKMAENLVGAIITHATISSCGEYIVCSELDNLLTWETEKCSRIARVHHSGVLQLAPLDNQNMLVVSQQESGEYICTCFHVLKLITLFKFVFQSNVPFRQVAIVGSDENILVSEQDEEGRECLAVYSSQSGKNITSFRIEVPNYRRIIRIPHPKLVCVALLGKDQGHIVDIRARKIVRFLPRWNGACTTDGRWGLHAPSEGGMELIDMKTGKSVRTLLGRLSEGVFRVEAFFDATGAYAVYYHGGANAVRLVRVEDGTLLADCRLGSMIAGCLSLGPGPAVLVGGLDGSLTSLVIADPKGSKSHLTSLPSRRKALSKGPNPSHLKVSFLAVWAAMHMILPILAARRSSVEPTPTFTIEDTDAASADRSPISIQKIDSKLLNVPDM